MTGRPPGRLGLALGGGLVLGAAAPGVLPFGGALLVVPGLMAQFALVASRRPLRDAWLFGAASFAVFSWSIHHVMWGAYFAIVLVGGLYFVLAAAAARSVGRCRWAAFAIAAAGAVWLRAAMPEILYPHGQPVHSLAGMSLLLGALALGGEPLGNALLAALAAAAVELWRAWRVHTESFARAARRLGMVSVLAALATAAGTFWRPAPPTAATAVAIVAIEPGEHPTDPYEGLDEAAGENRYQELLLQRLVEPSRRALAEAGGMPDLVLWPESALPLHWLPVEGIAAGGETIGATGFGRAPTRLVVGAGIRRGGAKTPAAMLVDLPSGRVLAHQEKRRLVPGGEFLPFAGWLPEGLAAVVRRWFEEALGAPPDCGRGEAQPPLHTAAGVPFGTLMCYDNAFPEIAAEQVAAGAQFLVVLSNEAWYRGGAELEQLVAMTVCRAVELGVPIVRCTTDGRSLVIDRDGHRVDELPAAPLPTPAARILRAELRVGAVALGPMAPVRAAAGPFVGALLGLLLLHAAWAWARLRVARTAT